MTFYFVRHGETDWNVQKKIQGTTDVPLNENGLRQARELAEKLVQEKYEIDCAYTSPMLRAQATAQTAATALGIECIPLDDLAEMDLGKVWFGNNPEPNDYVADFSNITVSGIGSRAFMACVNIEGIILPDGCATIDAEAFNGSPKSTYDGVVMGNFKTVMQPTYHAGIAEYCTTNGLAYVDYDGNELKAPVTE